MKIKKFAQAARVVKLLERSRLILDVDLKSLNNLGGLDSDDYLHQFNPSTNIQEIRILLARKMTALVLGLSLKKTTTSFTQKIKKNILVTKQVKDNI